MKVRLTRGGGVPGTGTLLLAVRCLGPGSWLARPWQCVGFIPLRPLPSLRLQAAGDEVGEQLPTGLELDAAETDESPESPARTWLKAAVGVLAVLASLALAFWVAIYSGLAGTAWFILSGAVPIVLLAYLDLTLPRLRRLKPE